MEIAVEGGPRWAPGSESDTLDDADARAVTATSVLARTDDGWKIAACSNAPANR